MLISEIDQTTPEGTLLMQALKLRSIEHDKKLQDCLDTVSKFDGTKPLPETKPYDYTADLIQQVRHLESENNRLKEFNK